MKTKLIFPSRISSLAKLDRLLRSATYRESSKYILVDANTYEHCIPLLISRVDALEGASFFEVPVGEEAKSIEVATQLWQALLESGADRNSVIINLGGGVVSDIGGFVAAGFKRGVRYINVPTTLLAMVDAAIGGKTAVNLDGGKNQVGFFHMPDAVCICTDFLETLGEEEMMSGMFEMFKTLMISDDDALTIIDSVFTGKEEVERELLESLIVHCAEFKQSVVNADPVERSVRKILNFGHTFGHAIESFSIEKGNPISHGIAVGIGMACELYLSHKKLGMSEEDVSSYRKMVGSLVGVPKYTLRDTEKILSFMRQDKKNHDGLILCTLLQKVGVPVIDVAIDENEVRDALLCLAK